MEPSPASPAYAELHCLSCFSFQRGASQPEELVQRAAVLGYQALAITDECSVAGVVRAHAEVRKHELNLKLLLGAEFSVALESGQRFTAVVLVHKLQGWGNLCQFITGARRAAPKGQYQVGWQGAANQALWAQLTQCEILLQFPDTINMEAAYSISARARCLFGASLWLGAAFHLGPDDALRRVRLQQLSALTGVPIVAMGGVRMHVRSRKPLHDVMTAVRLGQPVAQCGFALQANAERHLRSRVRLAALYPAEWLANTLVVADKCKFDLKEIAYHYPLETLLPGATPAQTLRHYCDTGARDRYPLGVPDEVLRLLARELALIAELKYEMYFLTVHDIVRFARSVDILCQGRGSAANSVVCYCLHVTEVNPIGGNLMFERFLSRERNEPPDIDVDFEHQRREEVIQYIYAKYGRERAAIAATVISYRPRSALRDVGHALDIPEALITELAKEHPGMYNREVLVERLQDAVGRLDPDCVPPPLEHLELWMSLATQLQKFPRHLSQHVGGFVLTQGLLTRLVPVENAAMPDRSIIQWDKDDLDSVGLMKVDVLALGMLSALRRCLVLTTQWRKRPSPMRLQDVPREDEATYDMICKADTVGVFQIESRAQMSMLPRLRPREFYDLVVQVAIVRPGPIQGGMVHPYLKARKNPEAAKSPYPRLQEVLERTHGVPIFQEQVMQIAVVAADFTPGEADGLRRSMAAWKRHGNVSKYHDRLVNGMLANGYPLDFAEAIFRQMEGFGEYGFPESHAASFAILVYFSCWFKWHEPACFLAALLNSQPLGFYGPSQLVQDAQRHGVEVRAVDVSHSDWDCTLEEPTASDHTEQPAVRLGLRMVSGLRKEVGERIAAGRMQQAFTSTQDLALRCSLNEVDLKALASADALLSLSGHRRQQVWDASALKPAPALLQGVPIDEDLLQLPAADEGEEVVFDYASVGLTLRSHPLALMRGELAKKKLMTATQLATLPHGRLVRACGLVTMRQRPQTAKGVIFITLEDETGSVNVIVWKAVRERFRQAVYRSRLLMVYGEWQRDEESGGNVRHVIAKTLVDLTPMLGDLATTSRDFH